MNIEECFQSDGTLASNWPYVPINNPKRPPARFFIDNPAGITVIEENCLENAVAFVQRHPEYILRVYEPTIEEEEQNHEENKQFDRWNSGRFF